LLLITVITMTQGSEGKEIDSKPLLGIPSKIDFSYDKDVVYFNVQNKGTGVLSWYTQINYLYRVSAGLGDWILEITPSCGKTVDIQKVKIQIDRSKTTKCGNYYAQIIFFDNSTKNIATGAVLVKMEVSQTQAPLCYTYIVSPENDFEGIDLGIYNFDQYSGLISIRSCEDNKTLYLSLINKPSFIDVCSAVSAEISSVSNDPTSSSWVCTTDAIILPQESVEFIVSIATDVSIADGINFGEINIEISDDNFIVEDLIIPVKLEKVKQGVLETDPLKRIFIGSKIQKHKLILRNTLSDGAIIYKLTINDVFRAPAKFINLSLLEGRIDGLGEQIIEISVDKSKLNYGLNVASLMISTNSENKIMYIYIFVPYS